MELCNLPIINSSASYRFQPTFVARHSLKAILQLRALALTPGRMVNFYAGLIE